MKTVVSLLMLLIKFHRCASLCACILFLCILYMVGEMQHKRFTCVQLTKHGLTGINVTKTRFEEVKCSIKLK